MTPSRIAAYAFFLATLAVLGAVAWLSPVQGNDWNHLLWAHAHDDDGTGAFLAAFVAEHKTFHDVVAFALASSTLFHTIVTPLVGAALLYAMFVVAARRRPNFDDWHDVLILVTLSALLWFAAPRAGVTWFHRPHTAQWIYGAAVTLWFLAPFRCGWNVPRWATPFVVLAGFCAGSSARLFGLVALVLVVIVIRRATTRAPWMWAALAGLLVGTVLSFLDRPQIDFSGLRPTIEATLTSLDMPARECGELISLVLGLVFVKVVLARIRPALVDPDVPDTSDTLGWLGLWFGLVVIAMFGPKFTEASLLPASITLCIAAYPYLCWLATTRPLRILLAAIAIVAHLIVWALSLSTYADAHRVYTDRLQRLSDGSDIVTISPYTARPNFWFFGEDFGPLRQRQLVARALYDLDDIRISPTFRGYELPTEVQMHLEVEGVTDAQLATARAPRQWATAPAVARKQLEELVARLKRVVRGPITARLVVDLASEVAGDRPILAGAYENGVSTLPRVTRRGVNETNAVPITVRPASFVTEYPEAFVLDGMEESPLEPKNGVYKVPAQTVRTQLLVACNATRCILVDAFVPRL